MEHETVSASQNDCIARQCGHALFTLMSSNYQAQSMILHAIAWWSVFWSPIMYYKSPSTAIRKLLVIITSYKQSYLIY